MVASEFYDCDTSKVDSPSNAISLIRQGDHYSVFGVMHYTKEQSNLEIKVILGDLSSNSYYKMLSHIKMSFCNASIEKLTR